MNPKKDRPPPQPDENFFPFANGADLKSIEVEADEEELAEED